MSDENNFWIPRNLDAQRLFFIWEADSAFLFIFFLIMGGLLNMFVLGAALAIFVTKFWQYLKEEGGRGLIIKILYWYTPTEIWLSRRNPSHIREYLGG